jgi:hypothetical protein
MSKFFVVALYVIALHWNVYGPSMHKVWDRYFGPSWKSEAAAAHNAAHELVAMTAKAGRPPHETNPEAAKLLDSIFNVTVPRDGSPINSRDAILDWINSAGQVGDLYLRSGLKPGGQKNIMTYGPEVGRYLDTTLQLAVQMQSALVENEHRPQVQLSPTESRLLPDRMGKLTTQLLTNDLFVMTLPHVSDDWRSKRMTAIMQVMDSGLPSQLSSQQRMAVYDAASGAMDATGSEKLKEQLAAFRSAFEDPLLKLKPFF